MAKNSTEILVNGVVTVRGDSVSLAVIFNNLSGANFNDGPPWRTQTHAQYIDMMVVEFKCELKNMEISLVDDTGNCIDLCKVGSRIKSVIH